MEEWFFSGYCRQADAGRTVAVELDDGILTADCCYGSCPWQDTCPVAQSIREKTGIFSNAASAQ